MGYKAFVSFVYFVYFVVPIRVHSRDSRARKTETARESRKLTRISVAIRVPSHDWGATCPRAQVADAVDRVSLNGYSVLSVLDMRVHSLDTEGQIR